MRVDKDAKYILTLSDNEQKIVTGQELQEAIDSAYEFDGFLGFTYEKLKPGDARLTRKEKTMFEYVIRVQAYKYGSVQLATFSCQNDEQASKIANAIIDAWEEAVDDTTYRWYLTREDQPERFIKV